MLIVNCYLEPGTLVPLRPLYFEVPQEETNQLTERPWIYKTIQEILSSQRNTRNVVIHGASGSGEIETTTPKCQ